MSGTIGYSNRPIWRIAVGAYSARPYKRVKYARWEILWKLWILVRFYTFLFHWCNWFSHTGNMLLNKAAPFWHSMLDRSYMWIRQIPGILGSEGKKKKRAILPESLSIFSSCQSFQSTSARKVKNCGGLWRVWLFFFFLKKKKIKSSCWMSSTERHPSSFSFCLFLYFRPWVHHSKSCTAASAHGSH